VIQVTIYQAHNGSWSVVIIIYSRRAGQRLLTGIDPCIRAGMM
jgi:hypothetical protein